MGQAYKSLWFVQINRQPYNPQKSALSSFLVRVIIAGGISLRLYNNVNNALKFVPLTLFFVVHTAATF